jgi:hypothetical protein
MNDPDKNIPDNRADFMIDLMTAKIAELFASANNKTITDSIREFMTTKTYALLLRPQSYLYLESPEYVLDKLDAEQTGDIERWLEV